MLLIHYRLTSEILLACTPCAFLASLGNISSSYIQQ